MNSKNLKCGDKMQKVDKEGNVTKEYIETDLAHATSNGKLHRKHLLDILKGVDKEWIKVVIQMACGRKKGGKKR